MNDRIKDTPLPKEGLVTPEKLLGEILSIEQMNDKLKQAIDFPLTDTSGQD